MPSNLSSICNPVNGLFSKELVTMEGPNGNKQDLFDSVEDTLLAFKNGEFIIVLDSPSRENEGDLIIAAQDVTEDKMAFMIRHTSGLICAPLSPSLTDALGLPQMVLKNTEMDGTAYTISVDAIHPTMTTGISAHDRALTCRMLSSMSSRPTDFRRPGHLLPLRAKEGGIRQRSGHTEATIEFCKLAGKRPAGVLCELIGEGELVEGKTELTGVSMLRGEGCLKFGKRWGIRVCTIDDLVVFLDKYSASSA